MRLTEFGKLEVQLLTAHARKTNTRWGGLLNICKTLFNGLNLNALMILLMTACMTQYNHHWLACLKSLQGRPGGMASVQHIINDDGNLTVKHCFTITVKCKE